MIYDLYTYLTNMPSWQLLCGFMVGYMGYYLVQVVKVSRLIINPTLTPHYSPHLFYSQRPILAINKSAPFKQFLRQNVPILEQKFWPTFWCVESRAQTVFAAILRSQVMPRINYRRELLTLADGGVVAIDWLDGNSSLDAPVVIILPGLTGESQAEYIKFLVLAANQAGLRAVVFNNRGMGGVDLKTRRMYCAANCEDLCEVVRHVARTHPKSRLGATGISMGGLILGNYLAVHSEEAQKFLSSAMVISVPWDVHKGTISIEKPGFNNMMGRHLVSFKWSNLYNI